MKSTFVLFSVLAAFVTATPDCYDYSVTTISEDYFDLLPKMLFYGNVDWMKLQGGKNCGFYTYGDVFIRTYDASTSGIYFTFTKTLGSTCQLNTTLNTFKNETWLYANSLNADQNVCGYYVGVANSGSVERMLQIVRSEAISKIVGIAGTVLAVTAMLFY